MNKKEKFIIVSLIAISAALYGQNADDFEIIGTRLVRYRGTATEVDIPNGVTSIGSSAFAWTTRIYADGSLISFNTSPNRNIISITIPASVLSFEDPSFAGFEKLTSINVDERNTVYSSVNGVLFDKAKTTLIKYPQGKQEKNFNLPPSVTSIGDSAFSYCTGLTNITIPPNITSIGNMAFLYCLR